MFDCSGYVGEYSSNNTVTVNGIGSIWSNEKNGYVGPIGSANKLIITNGAVVFNNCAYVGNNCE